MHRPACIAAALLAAAAFAPPSALAQDAPDADPVAPPTPPAIEAMPPSTEDQVRRILADAVAEYDAGRYPEAQALFRQAHELAPTARTLRGIGMASFEMRQYVAALRALREALVAAERPLTDAQRAQVEALIIRATAFVARVRVELDPQGTTLRVDGVPVEIEEDGTFLLDAGRHVFGAEHAGHRPGTLEVQLEGGRERSIAIHLTPAAEEDDMPDLAVSPSIVLLEGADPAPMIAGVAAAIGAGLLVGASVTTGALALQDRATLARECPSLTCDGSFIPTRDRARDLALATDVLWISAIAVGAAGTALIVYAALQPPRGATAAAACTPDGCAASIGGAF
jgi:hypothetical protein